MDLAYVDKLAEDNNGLKYLLVRQDLFGRTVDAKGMKRKDSKETVRAFLTMITKKNRPNKNWVDKGTEFAGEFKKLCKAEGIHFYSTMSETKVAIAERTIRCLKNILYHYMQDNGYKYIQKLTQLVTTLSFRRNCSIDLIPNNVENSDFWSILYSKPIREFRKPQFKIGDGVRISKYDLPFRKGNKPQFTQEVFEIVAIFPENLQHTQKNRNKMRLSAVNFIRKRCSKSFNSGIVYKRDGFKCIYTTISRQFNELFYKLFTSATESGWSRGGCKFRNIIPINVPKCYGGEIYVFLTRNFQNHQNLFTWNLVCTLPLRILLKPWTLLFKKDTITAKTVSKLKCLEERKTLRFTLQMKDLVLHF